MKTAHIILTALIWATSFSVFAIREECPSYVPPSTLTATEKFFTYSTTNQRYYSAITMCTAKSNYLSPGDWKTIPPVVTSDTPQTFSCRYTRQSDGNTFNETYNWQYQCPVGYNQPNYAYGVTCTLSNPDLVPCPPCSAGKYMGNGTLSHPSGQCGVPTGGLCWQVTPSVSCKIDLQGVGTGLGDCPTSTSGDWKATGESCSSQDTTGTLKTDNPTQAPETIKYNCIENSGKKLCFDRQKPGCGTFNGKEFCSDKILNQAGVGRCIFVGSTGYICGHNPPTIAGEPAPSKDFKVQIPIQDSAGQPSTAGPAATFGTPGPANLPTYPAGGSSPGFAGTYPGPSGNGTGQNDTPSNTPGGDGSAIKVDTDGDGIADGGDGEGQTPGENACQTHPGSIGCQAEGTYWTKFAQNIKDGITQSLGTPGEPDNLQTHNTTLSANPSVPQDASCPASASISIAGQSIAFPYDSICTLSTGIRPVVLAVAGLVALYILIGVNRMTNE
jgi:hypothetical protein